MVAGRFSSEGCTAGAQGMERQPRGLAGTALVAAALKATRRGGQSGIPFSGEVAELRAQLR